MTDTRRPRGGARKNPWGDLPGGDASGGDASVAGASDGDASGRNGAAGDSPGRGSGGRRPRARAARPRDQGTSADVAAAAAPGPADTGEVLFYATRPLRADLGAWGVICLISLPLALADPATWAVAAVSGLVFAFAANRRFRFELTATGLRLRSGLVGGMRTFSFAEIAQAVPSGFDGRPSAGRPRIGFLRIQFADGRAIASILHDPAEAADALRLLASRASA